MRQIIDPNSGHAIMDAPPSYRRSAVAQGKQLIKIVWDEADGYPRHAWGYVQWSIRPYELWYGCDGTTDCNIHLITQTVCNRIGIDWLRAYNQAYPLHPWNLPLDLDDPFWQEVAAETITPTATDDLTLCGILHDLHDINNHSYANRLQDAFLEAGYDVAHYWERNPYSI